LIERERCTLPPFRSTIKRPDVTDSYIYNAHQRLTLLAASQVASLLRRKDDAEGYEDLVRDFGKARLKDAQRTLAGAAPFTINKKQRYCIWMYNGAEIAFDVELRGNTFLCFGVGVEPHLGETPQREIYQFSIELEQNGQTGIVFHKELNPFEDTRWFDFALPLTEAIKGPARLIMKMTVQEGPEFTMRRGLWSRPFLTDRATRARRGQKSETADISAGAIAIQKSKIERLERRLEKADETISMLETQADALQKRLAESEKEKAILTRQLDQVRQAVDHLETELREALPIVEKHNKSIAAKLQKYLRK
jgi:hypothetical protein